jgi:hypothetical protein
MNNKKGTLIILSTLLFLAACSDHKSGEQATDNPVDTVDSVSNSTVKKTGTDLFPAIDIKSWKNTPVVNGRLPTREETSNGTSLLYYENPTPDIKAYDITLPKLAYYNKQDAQKGELVVVIQVVQTAEDTLVGYRPLAGGNGASYFSEFRFLTDDEVKKVTGE